MQVYHKLEARVNAADEREKKAVRQVEEMQELLKKVQEDGNIDAEERLELLRKELEVEA